MFTVTFRNNQPEVTEEISRTVETLKEARKWAKWLEKQTWVSEARIFKGHAGEELVYGQPR